MVKPAKFTRDSGCLARDEFLVISGSYVDVHFVFVFYCWARSCRWEAVKAVYGQMERIVKALLTLSSDKDPKTYFESRALLTAICDLEFIFGLCVLKVILSNTNSLC